MPTFRCAFAIVLLTIRTAVVANAQTEKTFATDDEIILVRTQAERAIQQYKPLINQEETQIGKSGTDAIAHDRQVVNALEMAVRPSKASPKGSMGHWISLSSNGWMTQIETLRYAAVGQKRKLRCR